MIKVSQYINTPSSPHLVEIKIIVFLAKVTGRDFPLSASPE